MTSKRPLLVAIAVIVTAAMTAAGGIAASPGQKQPANQLLGTWQVTVNRGPTLPPLRSLQTYTPGGGVIEMANEAQATRTPAFGSWERIQGRLYASTTLFFRFDPQTGTYLGWQKIDRTIRVAPDGKTFVVAGRATQFDAAGNVTATNSGLRATGERVRAERIPDQP
jgi:hypothetical protein